VNHCYNAAFPLMLELSKDRHPLPLKNSPLEHGPEGRKYQKKPKDIHYVHAPSFLSH